MHRFRYPFRIAGVGLALALTVAACGTEAAPDAQAAEVPAGDDAPTPSATAASSGSENADAAGPPAAEGPAAAPSHLFPDLSTVNIVDGSTINLAQELAGGEVPVLLWFWAPH